MTSKLRVISAMILGACLAVALLLGGGQLLASTLSSHSVPPIVNYQGYLTEANGDPVSGTVTLSFSIWDASSAGNQIWTETHNSVAVHSGYFSVFLGSQGTPLTPSVFSSPSRYLELVYDSTTFARQRFASVPYALVAQQASEAITSTYATTATYALNAPSSSGGVEWEHVVVVAKSGGDYTTVTDAMNAISPSSLERYLVLVMPGLYEEQVTLKEYVHLKGAGVKTTYISSTANSASVNDDAAATMLVPANAQVSDLTVRNTANTNSSVGMRVVNGNANTILNNIHVDVSNAGGTSRRGLEFDGGELTPQMIDVEVNVSGGTQQNWGVVVVASKPVIQDSATFADGGSNSAYALRFIGGSAEITDSSFAARNGAQSVGLSTSAGSGDDFVYVDRSTFRGGAGVGSGSINGATGHEIYVGASLLDGQAVSADVLVCAQSYDGDYAELGTTCS